MVRGSVVVLFVRFIRQAAYPGARRSRLPCSVGLDMPGLLTVQLRQEALVFP